MRTEDIDGNGHSRFSRMTMGELVKSIAGDTATLVRKEVELAKQEVTESVTGRLKGAIAFAAAGILGLLAVAFLGAAGATALDLVFPAWASRLIVTGVFLVAAAVMATAGVSMMRRGSVTAERTRETLKEDVEWAKEQLKR